MTYEAKILADSISPDGVRLTTMQVTFPRIVLAEFNTHRMFSRNSASSRAIPVEKMIARVKGDPFIPIYWGKNQKGMQADEELSEDDRIAADTAWRVAMMKAVSYVEQLLHIGVHKQIANRLLEPWLWHTVIVTATEWENFFALRCHKDAQPEIRKIAEMMRELHKDHQPSSVRVGGWHLPLVQDDERTYGETHSAQLMNARISSARCARVSYLTHEGKRDQEADLQLADRLHTSGHMSPFEHAATPMVSVRNGGDRYDSPDSTFFGNLRGWLSYRKTLPGEAVFKEKR